MRYEGGGSERDKARTTTNTTLVLITRKKLDKKENSLRSKNYFNF